jgi:GNAT superfamily N-acetyltransferase
MRLRAWDGPTDTRAVQELGSRLWPRGPHPGGTGWVAAIQQLPTETVLADSNGVVGWAGLAGGDLSVQVGPGSPAAARALVDWGVAAAGGRDLALPVFDGDDTLLRAATDAGFVAGGVDDAVVGMFRAASPGGPHLPVGYRARNVGDAELAERVEAHRAAWRPASLPWPADVLPTVSPDLTSRFTAAHYGQVRRTWLYDQELDLVIEAPDGRLAACCIVWWDPSTRCAEIEPLGVVPEHRRKGLATGLCLEAAARVAARGGDQLFINIGPRADYPAPAATYATVGFTATPRACIYRLAQARQ